MNDFENRLAGLTRARPSARLDERMERLFAAEERVPRRPRRIGWWWGFAAGFGAATVAAVVAITVTRISQGRSHVVIRRVAPTDPVGRLLDAPSHPAAKPRIIVHIETVKP